MILFLIAIEHTFAFKKILVQICTKGKKMDNLNIKPTQHTPKIQFSPEENIFIISGTSAPEDVRALYYPVINWMQSFVDQTILNGQNNFTNEKPLRFQLDLSYFNSTSAKFFYDIFLELKKAIHSGIPVKVEWYYDAEDIDMKEAGIDIAQLAEMEFTYISK
jgi:hypothetical protein